MPQVTIKNLSGADAGSVQLSDAVFAAEKNAVLVRELYNATMANRRQGTHSTKTRGMVRGGGKKPWKQKHTGRARQGSIRAPQWRGGAIIFGPSPRSYREKVNRKKRQGAYRALLTSKLEAGELIVIEGFSFSAAPKTKEAVAVLKAVGAKGKTLVITREKDENLLRAAGNLRSSAETPVQVQIVDAVSIIDLLLANSVVITRDALEALQERLA